MRFFVIEKIETISKMPIHEKVIEKVYETYYGSLSDPERNIDDPQSIQHCAYKDLGGTLKYGQYYNLLRKFLEVTIYTFSNRTDLPPDVKQEWIAQGRPDIRKFVWDKWSKEVFALVDDEQEPRRIFISVDACTKFD
jgi:hypothetical protein